jgi:hypothetical protein
VAYEGIVSRNGSTLTSAKRTSQRVCDSEFNRRSLSWSASGAMSTPVGQTGAPHSASQWHNPLVDLTSITVTVSPWRFLG